MNLPPSAVRVRLVTAPVVDEEFLTVEEKIPFMSLAPAQLCGYMLSNGYADSAHHDLNLSLAKLLKRDPAGVDLSVFRNEKAVDAYLTGSARRGGAVREAAERILDLCSDGPAELFGLSLVLQHSMDRRIKTWLSLDLSLVHAMKLRHPGCVTVLGGLFHMDGTRQRELMLSLLSRCPSLDFVVEGPGEQALYNIARARFGRESFEETGQAHEEHDGRGYLRPGGRPAPERFAPVRGAIKKQVQLYNEYPAERLQTLAPALPAFLNAEDYRLSGVDLARLYRFPDALRGETERFLERTVAPLPLQFISGCSGACAHCACAYFPVAAQPAREAVRDLSALRDRYGSNHFIFMNNAINWSYDYALSFASELIAAKAGIRWTDSLMLSNLDARLADRLRESGMVRADIGVETASLRLRRLIHKPLSSAQVVERLRLLHENGIWCDINMIVGLPQERKEDVEENLLLLKDAAPYYVHCAVNQFFLIGIAPMGREPERYGISVRPGMRRTKDSFRIPFDELGGPAFKARWASGRKAAKAVMDLKNPSFFYFPWHLMFLLYDVYGHGKKAVIEKVYGDLLTIQEDLRKIAERGGAPAPAARPVPPSPAPEPPAQVVSAPVPASDPAPARELLALLGAALLGPRTPSWSGYRVADASLREGDHAVWLRLERDGAEPVRLRLFRIRGPEDLCAARQGTLGLSFESPDVPGPVWDAIVAGIFSSLRRGAL